MARRGTAGKSKSVAQYDMVLSDEDGGSDPQEGLSEASAYSSDEAEGVADMDAEAEQKQWRSGKQTRGAQKPGARNVQDSEYDFSDSDAPAQSKKARRSSTAATASSSSKKGKGKAGRLESFQEMPLDVLCEIAGHLDPFTLLQMSRVSKGFRALFMSKSAKAIWIQARKTVFLPDLQAEDVSEAAYAALVYEKNCMICRRPRASIVDYFIRARWCKQCKKTNLTRDADYRSAQWHPQLVSCLPWSLYSLSGQNHSGRHYYFKPEAIAVNTKLLALQAACDAAVVSTKGNGKGKARAVDPDEGIQAADDPKAALLKYIQARKEIVVNARVDGSAIEKWTRSSALERRNDQHDQRQLRRAAIQQRLRDLGYSDSDISGLSSSYGCVHLIDQPRALTDAIWNRIGPQIIAEIQRNITKRHEREAHERARQRSRLVAPLYNAMVGALPTATEKGLYPGFDTFINFKSVQQHWKDARHDHEDFQIDQAAWTESLSDILSEVETQKTTEKRGAFYEIARCLKSAHPAIPNLDDLVEKSRSKYDSVTKADLPATITDEEMDPVFAHSLAKFICCKRTYAWPEVKVHQTAIHGNYSYLSAPIASPIWARMIRNVVQQMGFDEATFTDQQMNDLGAKFECRNCDHGRNSYAWYQPAPIVPVKKTELTWAEVVEHALTHHMNMYRYGNQAGSPSIQLMGQDKPKEGNAEAGPSTAKASQIDADIQADELFGLEMVVRDFRDLDDSSYDSEELYF